MKILVDCIPFDLGKSGMSVYMESVVKALSEQGHELTLLLEKDGAEALSAYPHILLPSFTSKKSIFSILYHLFVLPFRLLARRKDFDLAVLCAGHRRVWAFYPIRTAAVVHDLAPCRVGGKYSKLHTFYQRRVVPFFVRRARYLFATSKFTAGDMVKFWHVPENRVKINYSGLILHKPGESDFIRRHGLTPGKYILCAARLEHPQKNQLRLIQAYGKLSDEWKNTWQLVLAGAFWNEEQKIRQAAREAAAPGRILFPGFLSDADLESAYRHAGAYVNPSLYEGFSLSLLEAMHHGLPCACAETSSLCEVGRGAALLFDPMDADDISAALTSILSDEDLRERLSAQGRHRAGEFRWDRHAKMLANAAAPTGRKKSAG